MPPCLSKAAIPALLIASSLSSFALAGDSSRLSPERVAGIIETSIEAFRVHYVCPEVVGDIERYVAGRRAAGEYDRLDSVAELTGRLRRDFRHVTDDRHIWIDAMENLPVADGGASKAEIAAQKRADNFGFVDVKLLPGGIAYLRFDRFDDVEYAAPAAAEAMAALAAGDAIIMDLRENHGGHSNMVRFLCSYLFAERTQLNSLYFVEADSLVEAWTDPSLPGTKLLRQKLFILTSERTASGAESFAYALKHYGRATIVGESTRGAAHWKETYQFPEVGIFLEIPVARPINPVTGCGWEGVGVQPDVMVPAEDALETAQRLAREALQSLPEGE
ncbi:MAG: hypothetical protein JW819_13785 [Candidatus Krumholzibacteriota bacterium]|nr:hypothetical protein [Candidatus Krumholzibacteriota bacterium]